MLTQLCLDHLVAVQATANVDPATDATIQDVIRTDLPNTSVITIAHRLATVVFYDRILVLARDENLEAGTLAEYDAPLALLERDDSIFHGMCEATGNLVALMREARTADEERKSLTTFP